VVEEGVGGEEGREAAADGGEGRERGAGDAGEALEEELVGQGGNWRSLGGWVGGAKVGGGGWTGTAVWRSGSAGMQDLASQERLREWQLSPAMSHQIRSSELSVSELAAALPTARMSNWASVSANLFGFGCVQRSSWV
jgi:hypothetical protein